MTGRGKFAHKISPQIQEVLIAVESISTLPFQDTSSCESSPQCLRALESFMFIWPLESTLRLINLGLGTRASVWTLVSSDRGAAPFQSLRDLAKGGGGLQMAIKADGCIWWSLVTCGSDNEVFWSPDNILFCHYGFLPLVTSPNLYCFTAYF